MNVSGTAQRLIALVFEWIEAHKDDLGVEIGGAIICSAAGKALSIIPKDRIQRALEDRDGRFAGVLRSVIGERRVSDLSVDEFREILSTYLAATIGYDLQTFRHYIPMLDKATDLYHAMEQNSPLFKEQLIAGLREFENDIYGVDSTVLSSLINGLENMPDSDPNTISTIGYYFIEFMKSLLEMGTDTLRVLDELKGQIRDHDIRTAVALKYIIGLLEPRRPEADEM